MDWISPRFPFRSPFVSRVGRNWSAAALVSSMLVSRQLSGEVHGGFTCSKLRWVWLCSTREASRISWAAAWHSAAQHCGSRGGLRRCERPQDVGYRAAMSELPGVASAPRGRGGLPPGIVPPRGVGGAVVASLLPLVRRAGARREDPCSLSPWFYP